jgi:AcrR family transcriptional regulator
MSAFPHTKAPAGPLRERNRQRTYERIVQAAAELFRAHGFDATTMDDIAAHAEVSRATLFNYFGTKDSLLLPFIETAFNELILPSFKAHLDSQPDPFDAFRFLVMGLYDYMLAVPEIEQALRREIMRPDHWADKHNLETSGLTRALNELVRYGQRQGAFRQDIPAQILTGYLGSLVGSIIFQAVTSANTGKLPDALDTMLRFVRSGLQPN